MSSVLDRRQRGEGRLGLLISLVILGIAIFLAVKIIPVRVNAYQFKDFMRQECRFAAVRQQDNQVAQRILTKAEELGIPLEKQNLKLQRTTSEMIISASYEQPIDLKVTTYVYRFNATERAPLF
jgi:cell division protein FtsL